MRLSIASATACLFASVALSAEKPLAWPQFRGPNGSGVADGQKPPVEIGPDKNVKWKVPVPDGLSSPIIAGNKLILTAYDGGKLFTIAYDRANGKEAWRAEAPAKKIEAFHKPDGSPAASTSATDGERIVSYFGSCGLFCYDLDGKEIWKYELPTAITIGNLGSGVSPIIADGLVILVRDESKNPKILAVDLASGKLKWEKKRLSPASYCTPIIWDTPNGKQIVAAGHGRLIGYDLKNGDEKWFVEGTPSGCCSSPVALANSVLFAGWSPGGPDDKDFQMPTFDALLKMGDTNKDGVLSKEEASKTFIKDFFDTNDANMDGKLTRDEWDHVLKFFAEGKNSAFALKAGGSGDVTKSLVWKKTKGLPYITSGIVYRGQYVLLKEGGLVTAYDAKSGDEIYLQERAVASGRYYASPVAANGNIYFTSLDEGIVTVVKAGADKPEVIAKNPKLGEKISATPAIADDSLYIRTAKHLYAFAAK